MYKILSAIFLLLFSMNVYSQDILAVDKATPTPVITSSPTPAWTPVSKSSHRVVSSTGVFTHVFFTAPMYIYSATGKLRKIDLTERQTIYINGKSYDQYSKRSAKVGIRNDANSEDLIVVQQDKDWQYPDRRMVWGNIKTKYDYPILKAQSETLSLSPPVRLSDDIRSVGNDYTVYERDTSMSLLQRKPAGVIGFEITYTLKLYDLVCANEIGKSGFYIANKETNEFVVTTNAGEFRAIIAAPKLLSSSYTVVNNEGETRHTLQKISDGVYEYKKYSTSELSAETLQAAEWIDASLFYALSSIQEVGRILQSSWVKARDYSNGTRAAGALTALSAYSNHEDASYGVYRLFFGFDTEDLDDNAIITSAVLYINVVRLLDYTPVSAHLQHSTYGGGSASILNFNEFSGVSFGETPSVSSTGWTSITLNSSGVSDISVTHSTYYTLRESHDFENVTPGAYLYDFTIHGTTSKPYISISYTKLSDEGSSRRKTIINNLYRGMLK